MSWTLRASKRNLCLSKLRRHNRKARPGFVSLAPNVTRPNLHSMRVTNELYAKVGSTPLTALKTSSKCSFIPYKLRFLVSFRLVMKHDPTFA
uniref:Uncharacterized protein n=1 Tax=Candidatus Kentrum sp. DK TaxID=2126562 RepID=A0A450SR01_9GAMM|nr:MAG: hypothetical protein BECKDK2373B_GA0170837_105732 [Candidatus Kentron sp. DK]VFJ61419.1 MAG: hypothetical protein BECKDK2373C_GA0170839_10893 [Candidatus Kentron sp. DK]